MSFTEPGAEPGVGGSMPPPGQSAPAGAGQPLAGSQPLQPPGGQPLQAVGASGPRAGFWTRFAAALIDGIIVGIPSGILEVALKGAGYALAILLAIGYYTYFEGGPTGQGPGKKVMGIRVIDFATGGPIGYGRGFIRYIGRIVSGAVIFIGYLWMLWDREKQCWHDKFAGDVVVPVSAYPIPAGGGMAGGTTAGGGRL